MKIGILTFHRAWNYGAVLQCYALQEVLKGMGHDARVIDYRQKTIENSYRVIRLKECIKSLILLKFDYFKGVSSRYRLWRRFKKFRISFFNLSKPCTEDTIVQDFDAYIVGSDQLWVPKWIGGKFDPVYMGDFKRCEYSKVIGYAISCNQESAQMMNDMILKAIDRNFFALSLREKSVADILKNKINIPIRICLDPTLLLRKEAWKPLLECGVKHLRPYMVTYHLPARFSALSMRNFKKQTTDLARIHNFEVVDLSNFQYSVPDFVSLIANADLVVTTSFHASVFSLIFNKPLMAIELHDGHDDRYSALLNTLGASDFIYGKNFTQEPLRTPDYSIINKKMDQLRKPSMEYLKNSIAN